MNVSSYSAPDGTTTTASGVINSTGPLTFTSNADNTYLQLTANTTLSGTGILTLNGSASASGQIGTNANPYTLTNQITIQGSGLIGSNAGPLYQNLSLNNSGTIDGNAAVSALVIGGNGGSIINSGTFEATAGGTLTLASQAAINNAGGFITANAGTVNVGTAIQGGTLTTSNGGVMQTTAAGATLDATTNGAITLANGSTYTSTAGTTNITGTLNLGTSTGSTLALGGALELVGNTTLTGTGGVVNMSGNAANSTGGQIGTNGNAYTLTNNVTIQGTGVIGSNNTTYQNLSLVNNGTINANTSGQALTIGGTGNTITNAGLFEATGGGILNLSTNAAVANNGANITANAGTVNVGTTIIGGTLTTSNGGVMQTTASGATLDAASSGAITLANGSTYTSTAGTTNITGTLNLGTSTGSTLTLGGALQLIGNTTLTGTGGVVNISGNAATSTGGQIGTNGNAYTLTNNVTIQGTGVIGSNNTTYQNLSLVNNGTINANTSGQALTIGGTGNTITNAGLFEATGGGILNLSTNAAIANTGSNITANAGTVNVSTTIIGGTLNTLNGGVMQTTASGATLDASSSGPILLSDGSTYTSTAGLTKISGALNLGTSTGSTLLLGGQLQLLGNTTFSGPGVVTMTGNPSGNSGPAGAQIGTNGNAYTLTNSTLIQGSGLIGSNAGALYQNLSLTNSGIINANTNGATLEIGGTGNSIINSGTFEATNGATLTLATQFAVNNLGGNITANASTVNISNTTIQGGTLATLNGGVMQTVGTSSLDGTTQGAITIADGSTYTSGATAFTTVQGTLNLGTVTGSTLALAGNMQLLANTTLAGPGSLTLSGVAQIGTNGNAYILTNQATIQGTGLLGSNAGALYDNGSINNEGSIISNGGTLTVAETGGITNSGLFQANAGTTLHVSAPLTNFSGNTLTGGQYYVFGPGATIQLDALGTTGGEIANNAASIVLSGLNSNIFDANGNDALSNILSNQTLGQLSIQNGRQFNTTAAAFSNAGTVAIGATSLFQASLGLGTYTQSAGSTKVNGTLTASAANINGGLLTGTGIINGPLTVTTGGKVAPGDAPGTLTVNGAYTQTATGLLQIGIGGTSAGQFDVLQVNGAASLAGTLDFALLNGFTLASGESFDIMNFTSETGSFNTVDFTALNLGPNLTASLTYDPTELLLSITSNNPAVPEPHTWLLLIAGLAVVGGCMIQRRKNSLCA